MKTVLYIFVFFITAHSIALNRLFKYNSNNITIDIDKKPIISYENQGKTSSSKNKPPLVSEIIQAMIYLL
jgi:hypothetical protein